MKKKKGKYILPRSVPKGLMYKIMHESKGREKYSFSYNKGDVQDRINIIFYVLRGGQVTIVAECGEEILAKTCLRKTFLINQEYAHIRKDIIGVYLHARLHNINRGRKEQTL